MQEYIFDFFVLEIKKHLISCTIETSCNKYSFKYLLVHSLHKLYEINLLVDYFAHDSKTPFSQPTRSAFAKHTHCAL